MRTTFALVVATLLLTNAAAAQVKASNATKIHSALSAAPGSLSEGATLLDWPVTENAKPSVLRSGNNGWTCFPDYPGTKGEDPMCLDATWFKFINAHMTKSTPQVDRLGVGYMTAPGGGEASATDPYATAATGTNEWGHDGPHIMLVVPDKNALKGLPTKRQSAAPWVMWPGTPYAHIMVPIEGKH
jgi:hypothetical protein